VTVQAARAPINTPRMWIGIAVSVLCVVLVSRRVNWTSFVSALASVSPVWLGGSAVLTAAGYVCAGMRWRQVIEPEAVLTPREAYDFVVISNLATLVAPSRAGDLAKAALVSQRKSTPISRVLGAIVVERFGDVVMLIVLAAALSIAVRFPPLIQAGVVAFVAAGVAAIVAIVLAADRLPAIAGRVVGWIAPSWGSRISDFLAGIFSGIRNVGGFHRFLGTLAWSLAGWAFAGLAMWCAIRAFALPVPWYAAFFVLLVINLGGVIPASPGSIGVYHYLAVSALAVWMVNANVALGFAVVAHATGIVVITVLGLAGLASQHQSLFRVTA